MTFFTRDYRDDVKLITRDSRNVSLTMDAVSIVLNKVSFHIVSRYRRNSRDDERHERTHSSTVSAKCGNSVDKDLVYLRSISSS